MCDSHAKKASEEAAPLFRLQADALLAVQVSAYETWNLTQLEVPSDSWKEESKPSVHQEPAGLRQEGTCDATSTFTILALLPTILHMESALSQILRICRKNWPQGGTKQSAAVNTDLKVTLLAKTETATMKKATTKKVAYSFMGLHKVQCTLHCRGYSKPLSIILNIMLNAAEDV